MPDLYLPGLLLASLVIGFGLGIRHANKRHHLKSKQIDSPAKEYFVGLNYLLDDKTDDAIQAFIQALEVNSETIDTHLALGRLFRSRGEADKAVRLHQNLLARSHLLPDQHEQIQLELAQDFISLGVHDRARGLLTGIVEQSCRRDEGIKARKFLIDLLEKEQAYQQALDLALPMVNHHHELRRPAAHWLCELAEQAPAPAKKVRQQLERALHLDHHCVRANLMLASLEIHQRSPHKAIESLFRIPGQSQAHIATLLPVLEQACQQITELDHKSQAINRQPDEYLEDYLRQLLDIQPLTSVILSLSRVVETQQGVEQAITVTGELLRRSPSLRGLDHLIDLYSKAQHQGGHPYPDERLTLLKHHTQALLESRPRHRCSRCGFTTQTLAWQCPSCRQWGSITPVVGIDGE